jgi:hypothetical protein
MIPDENTKKGNRYPGPYQIDGLTAKQIEQLNDRWTLDELLLAGNMEQFDIVLTRLNRIMLSFKAAQ